MYPSIRYVSLFPPSLQWVPWPPRLRSPAVPHLHRYYGVVRLLPTLPGDLRSPLASRYLCRRMPIRSRRGASVPLGPGSFGGGEPHPVLGRRQGTLPGSWGIPLKACPGLGTPSVRDRPRINARPDSAFRQANSVGPDTMKRSRSCTLAARFLAVYASPHQSPGAAQHALPACPLRLWPGWTSTSWIPIKGFTCSTQVPPLPSFAWRYPSRGGLNAQP